MQPNLTTRILILGGGFGGVGVAKALERLYQNDPAIEVTLVNRSNYFLMTPLLFEAGSGILEPRHAVNPLRPLFQKVRFIEAEIQDVNLDSRIVTICPARGVPDALPYDHLVLAMGGITNTALVPGSEHALAFKTLGDAIFLRNHVIQIFERADVELDPQRKAAMLTFVLIGGGLVNVELCGELTTFLKTLQKLYPRVNYDDLHVEILEGGESIAREFDVDLRDYASDVLTGRGVKIRLNTRVKRIEPGAVHLSDGTVIASHTIVLGTGVSPSPLVARLALEKDKKGRAMTEPTLLCKGQSCVWALGDCANIPDPSGKPYPELAQHAVREAKTLAANLCATLQGKPLRPFVYQTKGTLAALGGLKGIGKIGKIKIRGFLAWWVWRSYYVMQMQGWSRRLRVIVDWTVALFFKNDIVQLDLFGQPHPALRQTTTQTQTQFSATDQAGAKPHSGSEGNGATPPHAFPQEHASSRN